MPNLTTLDRIADAASRFFVPELLAAEDFDSFEASVSERSRKIGALCLESCLESFDKMLREHLPGGWTRATSSLMIPMICSNSASPRSTPVRDSRSSASDHCRYFVMCLATSLASTQMAGLTPMDDPVVVPALLKPFFSVT